MAAKTYINDSGNVARLSKAIGVTDGGGVLRIVKTGYVKDSGAVWRTVFSGGFTFAPTLTNQTHYNIRAAAVAAGWDGAVPLLATVTIPSGVVIYGTSSTVPSLATGVGFPAGSIITIYNYGSIIGVGGNGGDGAIGSPSFGIPGGNAVIGGDGLAIYYPVTIYNYGLIAGGGGGGGGGGNDVYGSSAYGYGGGGGGGAGASGGHLGAMGTGSANADSLGTAATDGSGYTGGNGGDGAHLTYTYIGGTGGKGGDLGLSGANGAAGLNTTHGAGGYGANPGYAIRRNGYGLAGQSDGTFSSSYIKGSVG